MALKIYAILAVVTVDFLQQKHKPKVDPTQNSGFSRINNNKPVIAFEFAMAVLNYIPKRIRVTK